MCGVVGFAGDPSPDLLFSLIRESNIRGQHATGVSFLSSSGRIETHVRPGDATSFLLDPPEGLGGSRLVIAHSRYSTSDLRYSQPLADEEAQVSAVHNGVISQDAPEKWNQLFGYECATRNDSELVLRAYLAGNHPLSAFPEGSIAACILDGRGTPSMRFFRNGKRPLWYASTDRSVFVASTRDVLTRSGVLRDRAAVECRVGEEYVTHTDGQLKTLSLPSTSHPDLQHAQV